MSDTDSERGASDPGSPGEPDPLRIRRGRARATEVAGRLEFDRSGRDRRFLPRGVRSMVLLGSMSLSDDGAPVGQDPTTGGTVLLGSGRPGEERPRPGRATRALWRRLMALPPVDQNHPPPGPTPSPAIPADLPESGPKPPGP